MENFADVKYILDGFLFVFAGILVMWMAAGFAMLEAGLTRSKNNATVLTKNIALFAISCIMFYFVGYNFMYGDGGAFIGSGAMLSGKTNEDMGYPVMADFFFQVVFVATAASVISGTIAERMKLWPFLIFVAVLSGLIYPIQGHWTWGGGWLSELGFHDFAGSTIVHSVGAWAGLMGALILGPRIGKYVKGTSQAIPGHNLVIGALGVFILWLGWFGFNPGSELAISATEDGDSVMNVARIFITTNLAAAAGFLATMFVTWIRYKKADLSMSLNGVLAGLVAITAGCNVVSPGGAIIIGLVAGIVLVFAIEFIDKTLKIDDPVGAVSVHGVSGALGTILVGVFHTTDGLFYGGGAGQLWVQLVGVFTIMAFTMGVSYVLFRIINATMGLRVSRVVEVEGLDIHEHGQSVYN